MQDRSKVLEREGSGADLRRPNQNIFDGIPESAGPRLITFRGGAVHSVRPPGSKTFPSKHYFADISLAPAPRVRARLRGGDPQEYDAQTGSIVISPAQVGCRLIWPRIRESVVIVLKEESLRKLAESEFDCDHVELEPPPFGTIDLKALRIAQLLKVELRRADRINELYVDSLITIFGLHLLRSYTSRTKPPRQFNGGLTLESERQLRDYLNENFTRKTSVNELAAVAGLSPKHFIQAFTKTFGAAPHRYLLDLRLDFAQRLLVEGNLTIVEVAYLSGFSSQSHLTATMKRCRGTTPAQLRLAR